MWDTVVFHLELKIRNDGTEVRVSTSLAVTVNRSLHMNASILYCGERIRYGNFRIVVRMDAEGNGEILFHFANNFDYFVRQRAAVRVAKDNRIGSTPFCRTQCCEGVCFVRFEAVEEMLRVVDN